MRRCTRAASARPPRLLGEQRSPRLLVVDISGVDLPLSAMNELAEVCEPGVTVIAIGDRNDVGLFRDLINNGVSDYLVKPITPALMQKSLLNVVENADAGPAERAARPAGRRQPARAAASARPCSRPASPGRIANRRRRRVALVDLDLQFGTVALALDLEPSPGLREALEHPGRIDALFVERAMVRQSDTLYVLSGEESLGEPLARRHRVARHPAQGAAQQIPLSSWSTCRGRSRRRRSTSLQSATNLVLVTDLSLAGMRDTLRQLVAAADRQRGLPDHHRRQPRRRVPRGRDRRARSSRRPSAAPSTS